MNESPYSPPPTNSPYSPQTPPPQPVQPSYSSLPKITPSGWWYLLSAVFLAGGIIVAVVLIANIAANFVKNDFTMTPIDVPGQIERNIKKPGTYALYWSQNNSTQASYTPEDVKITVTRNGDDQPLQLNKPKIEGNMDNNELQRIILYTFSLAQPDVVTVSTEFADENTEGNAEIILGPFISHKELATIGIKALSAVASGLGGFIIALVIFIITIVRRSACKRRLLTQAYSQYPPPTQ